MSSETLIAPSFSTASFGNDAQTSPMELSALSTHRDRCIGASGRLFAARCAADSAHGFVAARLVTTLVAATLLLGAFLIP